MLAHATSCPPNLAEELSVATIAACARTCHRCFHDCFDRLHDYQNGGSRWSTLRDLIGRFNIWASNMGVFATVHASLDHRLRDLADVKELKLEHLRNMTDRLDQLYHLLDRSKKASVGSAKNTDNEPRAESREHEEIDSILDSISTSIDWLHRLANMVRRASTLRRNVKASTFDLKDELGGDATPALEQVFRHWIKRDFPNISDEFCERLIFTMLLRRRRILYRRARQTKLALRTVEPIRKPTHLAAPAPSARVEEKPRELPEAPLPPLPPVLAASAVASTAQTATTVEPQAYLKVKSTPSRVSGAKTISMTRNEKDMIPPPPRLAANALEFICPFCSLILPAKDARDRDYRDIWAAHVKIDLEPYVCHFFPCARGEDIFSTSTDWISHIQQAHCMRWRCMTKTHRPQTFISMEGYTAHMTAEHPGKFQEAQLPFLAANSQRPSRKIFKSCPLCGEDSTGNGESLEDHVAHHLQYLALLSLPLPEDLHETKGAASTSSTDSYNQQKGSEVAPTRTTNKSEWHLMQPATFPEGDEYLWETARPADDEIPDVDEQKQIEISQTWQLVRAGKVGLQSMDQPITEKERRSDKTLAAFVFRFDSMYGRMRKSPDIYTWLSPPDHWIAQQKARDARLGRESGHWFLHDKSFMTWKEQPASFLCLTGAPRCGKTILASDIIDYLRQEASNLGVDSHVVLYFYFNSYQSRRPLSLFDSEFRKPPIATKSYLEPPGGPHGGPSSSFRGHDGSGPTHDDVQAGVTVQDLENMIRSLVIQLYHGQKQTQQQLNFLWSLCQEGEQQPTLELLRSTFENMLQNAGEVWIILESLHDYDHEGRDVAPALFDWLSVLHSRQKNVHVLVTSRPEESIRSAIEDIAQNCIIDISPPLGASIRASMTVSYDGEKPREFLPTDKLQSLLTAITVYQELRRLPNLMSRTDEELFSSASAMCNENSSASKKDTQILITRKRIFATLVYMDLPHAIEAFSTRASATGIFHLNSY